jgi:hypothetical protein
LRAHARERGEADAPPRVGVAHIARVACAPPAAARPQEADLTLEQLPLCLGGKLQWDAAWVRLDPTGKVKKHNPEVLKAADRGHALRH